MNKCVNIFFVALLMVALVSCTRKISFLVSPVVPAAQGFVKVKKDNNRNYSIQVHLSNLAPPERLQPARLTYVIWMESAGDITKNIGQVNSSTSLLSKRLTSSFQTVSPLKPDKIFITAEDNGSVQQPGQLVVLTTEKF